MDKISLIIGREYWTRVKKPSFLIMTLLAPLIFVAFYGVIVALAMQEPDDISIHVVDESEKLMEYFPESNDRLSWNVTGRKSYPEALSEFRNDENQKYDILVWIPEDILTSKKELKTTGKKLKSKLLYRNSISTMLELQIRDAITDAREQYKLQNGNVNEDAFNDITASVGVDIYNMDKLDDLGQLKDVQADYKAAGIIGMICSFLIFMFIFMYGAQVMRGVIEEKTSRIVEVIISSVKPFELMMGKVIGVALVGLTQFVIWVVLSGILMGVASLVISSFTGDTVDMTEISSAQLEGEGGDEFVQEILATLFSLPWMNIIIAFFVFFLGGYLLYAAMFAAIGSAVDNETDTQQFMLPMILPLMLGFYIAQFSIFSDPDGFLMQLCSYIPFTSPVVMLMRIAMDTVTWWEVLISVVLLIGTFILVTWLAAKIYRTGILMYGKKATVKEMFNWIRKS